MRPKIERIGYLPDDDPFNVRVRTCFEQAGFQKVCLDLNADRSMLSFTMELGKHPRLATNKQAHATVRLLLREAGIDFARPTELFVTLKGDLIDGSFTPPDFTPSPPD